MKRPPEKEREPRSTPSRIENFLAAIEDGRGLEPDEVIPKGQLFGTFECLREMHRAFNDGTIGDDPQVLLQLLRETAGACKKLNGMKRAYWMAGSIAKMAHMQLSPGRYELTDGGMPPAGLPYERCMPPEYYHAIGMLAAADNDASLHAPKLCDPYIGTVMEAAKMLGDTVYGGLVQREFLRRIRETSRDSKVRLAAYETVPSKVLLPTSRTLSGAYGLAKEKMVRLEADKPTDGFDMVNDMSYVDGAQGVLGVALTLRTEHPDWTADRCVAFLYDNAAAIGALARRYNRASPTYRDVSSPLASHDAAVLLDGVKNGAYCLKDGADGRLKVVIPEAPRWEDEFPADIFNSDPEERAEEEEKLRARRMYGGGCPARFKVRLPEGGMKDSVVQLSGRIKERYEEYGADPKIMAADGKLDPAALMVARVIKAGELAGPPGYTLWTHGFEDHGVPVAGGASRAV